MASGLRVPHKQAAHMAAPTEGQNIKKALANGEPSTHGAKRTLKLACLRLEKPISTMPCRQYLAAEKQQARQLRRWPGAHQ
jgi:hypothetical protein